jgi:hypothetical protein
LLQHQRPRPHAARLPILLVPATATSCIVVLCIHPVLDLALHTHDHLDELANENERKKMNTRWFLRSAQLAAFQGFSVPFIAGIQSMPWRSPRSRLSRAIPRLGSSARLS